MSIILDQQPYPKEMPETTNKHKLIVNFSKAKLACYAFATIYYSNVFTCLQLYPHFLLFTYKVDLKISNIQKIYQKNNSFYTSAARDTRDI